MDPRLEVFLDEHERRLYSFGPDRTSEPLSTFPLPTLAGLVEKPLAFVDFGTTVLAEAGLSRAEAWCSKFRGSAYASSFFKARMHQSTFEDFSFIECNLMRADLSGSAFTNTIFYSCNLLKTAFRDATFDNVHFVRCTFDRTFLDRAAALDVRVVDPVITGESFLNDVTGPGAEHLREALGVGTDPSPNP